MYLFVSSRMVRPIHHHGVTRVNLPLRSHSMSQADTSRFNSGRGTNRQGPMQPGPPLRSSAHNNDLEILEERKYKTLDLQRDRGRHRDHLVNVTP